MKVVAALKYRTNGRDEYRSRNNSKKRKYIRHKKGSGRMRLKARTPFPKKLRDLVKKKRKY